LSQTMERFLSTLAKKTKANWKRGVELFTEWYGKKVDAILAERKDDLTPKPDESLVDQKQRADRFEKKLEEFHKWLLEERQYKINTARTYARAL
jgi:hypothetical protein